MKRFSLCTTGTLLSLGLLLLIRPTLIGQSKLSVLLPQGQWSPTGSMTAGRAGATATLLQTGKILVAGGYDQAGALSSAELYDPATGLWQSTSTMQVARSSHTATLLPDGRVLVAGGCTNSNCSATTRTSEVYDPIAGTWTLKGVMTTARYFFAATLLRGGKVLVEGGCSLGNCNSVTTTAELFDPRSGKWSATGSMANLRDYHSATLLNSGQVLVAGGFGSRGVTSSAELYDPTTGLWSPAGNTLGGHALHTATLLGTGEVIVAGGRSSSGLAGAGCELFDPTTLASKTTGSMGTARESHVAVTLPGGRVLVAGGSGFIRPKWYPVSATEIYNPQTGSWTSTGSMSTGRSGLVGALLPNGQVLAAGGYNLSSLSSAELYQP